MLAEDPRTRPFRVCVVRFQFACDDSIAACIAGTVGQRLVVAQNTQAKGVRFDVRGFQTGWLRLLQEDASARFFFGTNFQQISCRPISLILLVACWGGEGNSPRVGFHERLFPTANPIASRLRKERFVRHVIDVMNANDAGSLTERRSSSPVLNPFSGRSSASKTVGLPTMSLRERPLVVRRPPILPRGVSRGFVIQLHLPRHEAGLGSRTLAPRDHNGIITFSTAVIRSK